MRATKLVCLAALITLLLSSCDYTDPDRMAIITGAAIDWSEGFYTLTIETIKTEGSTLSDPIETETFSVTGESLDRAEAELEKLSGTALYWGHAQTLVLGEGAAEDALGAVLDWVMRSGDLRLTVVLAVSRESDAKSILDTDPAGSYTVASSIASATREGGFAERQAGSSAHRSLEALLDCGAALLPAVAIEHQQGDRSYAIIEGGAVLKGSTLAGFISDDEALDLLLLLGASDARELVLTDDGAYGLKLERISSSAASGTTDDGEPLLTVELDGDCTVEYYAPNASTHAHALDDAELARLVKRAEDDLCVRIGRAIRAVRRLGADVADFGEQFEDDFGTAARDTALSAELEVSASLEVTDLGLIATSPAERVG